MIKSYIMFNKCNKLSLMLFLAIISIGCESVTTGPGSFNPINWENGELIIPANEGNLSPETKAQYQTSAKKLALRHIYKHHPNTLEIPEPLVNLFYNGLIHVAKSSDPRAKFVTREQNIQASQPASPYEIMVVADTLDASKWLDSWRNGISMTGHTDLDPLMVLYGYELKAFHELSSMDFSIAILRTDKLLNGYASGSLFQSVEGITSAAPEPVFYAGFRKDIEAEIFEEYLLLHFIGGNSKFRVYSNGHVEFAGRS